MHKYTFKSYYRNNKKKKEIITARYLNDYKSIFFFLHDYHFSFYFTIVMPATQPVQVSKKLFLWQLILNKATKKQNNK